MKAKCNTIDVTVPYIDLTNNTFIYKICNMKNHVNKYNRLFFAYFMKHMMTLRTHTHISTSKSRSLFQARLHVSTDISDVL